MKKFSVILAVLFTLATTGQAFAFSGSAETNAQVYFAIPFGAQSKAEATPRFGFSVDYGQRLDDNGGLYGLQRINRLDFRLNLAGDASSTATALTSVSVSMRCMRRITTISLMPGSCPWP